MRIILIVIFSTLLISTSFSQVIKQYQNSQASQVLESTGKKTTIVAHQYSVNTISTTTAKHSAGMMSNRVVSNVADSLALVDLYLATNPGDTAWINANGWLSAPLNQWYGVFLDGNGRVNNLDLNNNNLTGILPQSLANLDSLEFFFFYVNPNLSGDLFSILKNYSKLKRVSAHDCGFTGIIDPLIFKPGLLEIRVFNNAFTGGIPDEIGLATQMEQFNISGNQISDSIPITIGDATNLKELNLSGNNIFGIVPQEIGNIDSLQFLFIENTALTGDFPATILNCNNLMEVWLSGNDLTGTFPNVLSLPNMRAIQLGGNRGLFFDIPDNIGDYTNLIFFSLWNTVPNGGTFPAGFYQLINLSGLDLSEQNFDGTITNQIAQLDNLESLYLRNNNLTGDLPQELSGLINLYTLDVSSNFFTGIPNLTGLPNLQELNLVNNYFQIADLQPYPQKGISFYAYAPQRVIGAVQELSPSPGTSFNISTAINDFGGSNYQWYFNRDSLPNGTSIDLTVNDFRTYKAGAYVQQATHPDLPDLTLQSEVIYVKAAESKTKWFVDNDLNHTADFRNLYQAISASSLNDTIYIAGSNTPYASADLFSSRVILGPGYFLQENPKTQFNKLTAQTPFLNITKDASGSQVYGMDIEVLYLNNQSSRLPDTLKNVILTGNKIELLTFGDKNDGIEVGRSFIKNLQINATTAVGVIRSYDNINVHNNIIDSVSTFFTSINTTNNGLNNFVFDYNTISHISDSINDVVFNNNIINVNQSSTSVSNGNIDFATANFINASASLSIDNDFQTQDANLDKGAFGGVTPYLLSGLPPIPAIYDIVVGPRLSLLVSAKNQDASAISRLRYLYRKDQLNSNSFQIGGFNQAQEISVQFLPNRSELQPNMSYEIVLVAIDEGGKRSHRTYVPYNAIAANLSGTVVDVDASAVNNGDVKLFAINPFANKYDTAAVQQLGGANTFNFQNLILGDYIILANPSAATYPDLIPTYLGNTIDWELADTLRLQQNISNVSIEVEKLPTPSAVPEVGFVSGIFEEEYEDADSSLRQVLPRRRVGGAGVSVRRLSNTTRNTSLRLFHMNTDLVAYVKTNENGEYEIPSLPEGQYAIRFEYPGVETDETSDVFFDVEDDVSESIQVDAKVENGKIVITNNSVIVANEELNDLTVSVFPNPANDYLNIGISYLSGEMVCRIIDLNGRLVHQSSLSETNSRIYIGDLRQGLYLVKLSDGKDLAVNMKIVKK